MHIGCYLLALGLNLGWLIFGDELSLLAQLCIPLLTTVLLGIGVLYRLRQLPRPAQGRYVQKTLWVLFLYYLAIVSVLLFFGGLFHLDRGWGGTVNLVPFQTIRGYIRFYQNTGSSVSLSNLLGNVIILLPLGGFLPLLFPSMRHVWISLPVLALAAVGVEYLQWLTATGTADVDDSILNFAGAVLGYLVVRVGQILYGRAVRRRA